MNSYAKLGNRAEHTLRYNSAELALFDLDAACKGGAIERNGNQSTFEAVGCGGNDLNVAITDIDPANNELVGIGMLFNLQNFADDTVGDTFGFNFITLDL